MNSEEERSALARMRRALQGLLGDVYEIQEELGMDRWAETVTAGIYHVHMAEELLGLVDHGQAARG